jgi:hypothetical protein
MRLVHRLLILNNQPFAMRGLSEKCKSTESRENRRVAGVSAFHVFASISVETVISEQMWTAATKISG